jgi:hypothetical protein
LSFCESKKVVNISKSMLIVNIRYIATGSRSWFRLMLLFKYSWVDSSDKALKVRTDRYSIFHLDEQNRLMWNAEYVHNQNGVLIARRESEGALVVTEDPFDYREYAFSGGYAVVYSPSLSNDPKLITRLVMNGRPYSPPQGVKDRLKPYCLFPLTSTHTGNVHYSDYTLCVNDSDYAKRFMRMSLKEFMVAFGNLWAGLGVMSSMGFFHSDIKISNTVLDNDVFKFIDFDLSFMIREIKNKKNAFRMSRFLCLFPTLVQAIMFTHVARQLGYEPSLKPHDPKEYKEFIANCRNRFGKSKTYELITQNVCPFEDVHSEYEIIMNRMTNDELCGVFDYCSVYQLTVTFASLVQYYETGKHRNRIRKFINRCLDFRTHGFVSTNAAIGEYNEIVAGMD